MTGDLEFSFINKSYYQEKKITKRKKSLYPISIKLFLSKWKRKIPKGLR